jgi:ribA/ribD-fused uncharacterized protein
MASDVLGFFGEHRFLSNFHLCKFVWYDIEWKSSEHAYQAIKLKDKDKMLKFSKLSTPTDAKLMGGLITLREDWEEVKYTFMYLIVKAKFGQNPDLADLLLATGDAYLEETNTWHDKTWGVCNGEGKNWLGEILMTVRNELQHTKMIDELLGD